MKSPWLTYCRPKKHQLLFSGPQNKKSQKGCVGLPYYGDVVWAGGRTVPNKQRWAASFLSLFLWESYRLCGPRNPPYHGLLFV